MPKFRLRTLLLFFIPIAAVLVIVCQAVLQVREAAHRATCRNRMRTILVAMLNYESSFGRLPVGIETNADGSLRRSWRTHLYPQNANVQLSSRHPNGVNVAFADGKIYFLKNTIAADDLRALFTIAGNEPITRQQLLERGFLE